MEAVAQKHVAAKKIPQELNGRRRFGFTSSSPLEAGW
jgi:hypothetical protein